MLLNHPHPLHYFYGNDTYLVCPTPGPSLMALYLSHYFKDKNQENIP